MTNSLSKIVTFTAKGGLLGFSLGIAGAVFGSIIGSSFATIWASGMPIAMGFMGAIIFAILSSIGLHHTIEELHHMDELHH